MKDWPLVVFTMAMQLACGLAAAATAFDLGRGPAAADPMRPGEIAGRPELTRPSIRYRIRQEARV